MSGWLCSVPFTGTRPWPSPPTLVVNTEAKAAMLFSLLFLRPGAGLVLPISGRPGLLESPTCRSPFLLRFLCCQSSVRWGSLLLENIWSGESSLISLSCL